MAALNLDKIKATLERAPEEFKNLVAQVGFPSGINYEDETPVATVAAWNEYGTSVSPARPFMRPTIKEQKDKWIETIKKGVQRVVLNKETAFDTLDRVGRQAAADIQTKISSIYSPPNAPSTIKRKGSAKPLIDTGYMLASVSSAVNKAGSEFKKD